jgi:hypothetical protein
VEAIVELPIKLHDGFMLGLHVVLYVPSLNRNLISVSKKLVVSFVWIFYKRYLKCCKQCWQISSTLTAVLHGYARRPQQGSEDSERAPYRTGKTFFFLKKKAKPGRKAFLWSTFFFPQNT